MNLLRNRRAVWFGLAGFVLGGIAAPLYMWWQVHLAFHFGPTNELILLNTFINLDDFFRLREKAAWVIIAWIGASVGGAIGFLSGFAITRLKKL